MIIKGVFLLTFIFVVLTLIILFHDFYFSRNKINKLILENLSLKQDLKDKDAELIKLEKLDPLTDILNRNRLDIELQREFARIKRSHKHMGIIMLGIDNLKTINKSISHSVGDYLLKDISSLLKKTMRKTDILGRWWGDKFLIIDSDMQEKNLLDLAEKLRKVIEEHKFIRVGYITASFGITISEENDDELTIIERVNKALTGAKRKGKNRVIVI